MGVTVKEVVNYRDLPQQNREQKLETSSMWQQDIPI